MIRGIDHLVIACGDPDDAARELETQLGISCTGGGRHEGHGTRNRIAWLADGSYLELIGVDDRDLALANPVGAAAVRVLEEHGGGLATYAVLVDRLDATAAGLRAAGASLGPAVHGTRIRDDGELVEWWTAVPGADLAVTAPPFLIEHALVGAEWSAEALAARERFIHPAGSPVVLTRLDIATPDPPALAAMLHVELGLDVWAVADLAVADVGRHVLRLVPSREMAVPAAVTLGAAIDVPRAVDLFGMRFALDPVDLPVPAVRVDS